MVLDEAGPRRAVGHGELGHDRSARQPALDDKDAFVVFTGVEDFGQRERWSRQAQFVDETLASPDCFAAATPVEHAYDTLVFEGVHPRLTAVAEIAIRLHAKVRQDLDETGILGEVHHGGGYCFQLLRRRG